jgi:hypothetical protein
MNKQITHIALCILPFFLDAQVTIISIHNQLSSPVFVTLSTTDRANNRQLSSQFTIGADDKVSKEIMLEQGQSFTMQINNAEALWKTATVTFKSMMQTKDNPPSKRTFSFNVELDGTAVNPATFTDSPRNNTIKNSRATLNIKKDGITIE